MSSTTLVIKQIGLPLRRRPILLITRIIKDRIGLHSVLLPLFIPKLAGNDNFRYFVGLRYILR